MIKTLPSRATLIALAAVVIFALSPVSVMAESIADPVTPSLSSSGASMAYAQRLIDTGRFEEALKILQSLPPGDLSTIEALFLLGLTSLEVASRETAEDRKNALLDQTITAFRSILTNNPGLVRVRLELARAFFLKGDDDLSRENFERALAGNPPPVVAANIRYFLTLIRQRRRWSSYFGISLAPSTNINAASENDTVYIFGLPFRFGEESGSKSGIGVNIWTGGEYQYPLGDKIRLRTGGSISRQDYAAKSFDRTTISAHIGPRLLTGPDTEFSILANVRMNLTAGRRYNRETGPSLEIIHRPTRSLQIDGRLSRYERSFRTQKHLDGYQTVLGLGGTYIASPTVRLEGMANYIWEQTEAERWRNATRRFRLGTSIALPRGFTLGIGGEIQRVRYKGQWLPFVLDGSSRRDSIWQLDISLFNRAFTIGGFSPQLFVAREVRSSNAQLYDYRRTRAEMRVVRQF
ncbi:MAG: surface lipoprotein assembly modifier [Parvularculales bacterium]